MTDGLHAFLAPSAAGRWVLCPASALLESQHPKAGDKPAAEEGTAAHWVATQLWDGWAPDLLLQDRAPNGPAVTRAMTEGAQLLIDDIREVMRDSLGPVQPVFEQRVAIPRVHPSANWGTPDARMWVPDPFTGTLTLYLWDYKFGHKPVEVYENWQLLDYAAGVLDERRDIPPERITIVFRIVQPRSYHRDGPIREWRVNAKALDPYIFRLAMAADDAMQPRPEARPHPDACENCTARHACETLQRAAYRGMDLAAQSQATELTPAALGLEMRYLTDAAALMKARLTGLSAQAESLRMRGATIPHWRAEPTAAREGWAVSDREAIVLGSLLGVNLSKEPEAVTPTQARALAKQHGVDASLLGAYASRPSGGLKLVPDDGSDARKVFANPV